MYRAVLTVYGAMSCALFDNVEDLSIVYSCNEKRREVGMILPSTASTIATNIERRSSATVAFD
jgi:hypothetical protein